MTRHRALLLAAVALTAVVAVVATVRLSGAQDRPRPVAASAPATTSAAPVRVVIPGRPGESSTVTDSDHVQAPDGSTYTTLDAAFVRMMVPHHEQALAMADLAAGRATDARVTAFAARIRAAQAPEILRLRAWLQARGLPVDTGGHDHATMPGMQDDAAMTALAAARGGDFDRRFVTMMTAHHRGALRMTDDVLAGGTDQEIAELAGEIAVEQGSEIRRLADLGLTP
jgi:uncharacterized protein (DUF305 family)